MMPDDFFNLAANYFDINDVQTFIVAISTAAVSAFVLTRVAVLLLNLFLGISSERSLMTVAFISTGLVSVPYSAKLVASVHEHALTTMQFLVFWAYILLAVLALEKSIKEGTKKLKKKL